MVAHTTTFAFEGLKARLIDVQVQMSTGLPSFAIVGLANKAVAESRDRIRGALNAIGLALPPKRFIVNLSPADLIKDGSHYDLPIALGILQVMDILAPSDMESLAALGELGLDGRISAVPGVLPGAIAAQSHSLELICPAERGTEAAFAGAVNIIAAPDLLALINHLTGKHQLTPPKAASPVPPPPSSSLDLADIKGQETAKRALEIAAAGGHNLLLIGPPGTGKSMLAKRLASILPPLTSSEILDISMINSIANTLDDRSICQTRPFRAPHHSASLASLVGGGARARPGEITLAHHGVLFLDELPEFSRSALESLRQPLEDGQTLVSRAKAHITWPARFQLIGAMNPCRCGMLHDADQACSRAPHCARDYQAKISGPVYDRIDLHCEMAPLSALDLENNKPSESSKIVRQRVAAARSTQVVRAQQSNDLDHPDLNSQLDGTLLDQLAKPDKYGQDLLSQAVDRFHLSGRGYHRVLRVSRTIADLDQSPNVDKRHIAEALSYRRLAPGRQGRPSV